MRLSPSHERGPVSRPGFHLIAPRRDEIEEFLDTFEEALARVRVSGKRADVLVSEEGRVLPKGFPSIISANAARRANCIVLGLEIHPVYRDPVTGDVWLNEPERG